ncbi:hypothetical protein OAZ07_00295 [Pelagibacteraceae bacterium]|nr:hypothetical protein [Pelagibacteraceae bacterium]
MKKIFFISIFIFLSACSGIEFIYTEDKNLTNPIYQKTKVHTSGLDMAFLKSYVPMFFGSPKENIYDLSINVEENKIKRSVETNQATSKLRYEINFIYKLILLEKSCVVLEKELLSYFSIIPKSSGYDYGTDSSLEKKYELAITENLNRFLTVLADMDLNNCT